MLLITGCSQTEFEKANGEPLAWESLRGDWVFVNYWAEWCKPCLEEIPELNELDEADNITVLGVNFDGVQGQSLLNLGQKMGIEFTILAEDPAPAFNWKLPVALPATFIVNPAGELVETRFGPQTEQELREMVRSQ
ncbi:TlpA family protein disulfide reductase [Marinobacter sp.]